MYLAAIESLKPVWTWVLGTLAILVSIVLVIIVAKQPGKEDGLSTTIAGGAEKTYFGRSGKADKEKVLGRLTIVLTIVLALLVVAMTLVVMKTDLLSKTTTSDTGSNFDGARDLDHTSEVVQNWAKAYTQWLLDVMKYDGFRYDMTLGYHGQYLSMYNEAANPYISVSELWESIARQKQHLEQAKYNTMIFDFPLKYSLNDFKGESYGKLNKNKTLNSLRSQGLERYSVTFIDNHDTFERSDNQGGEYCGYKSSLANATIKNKILQANAYILMMPGIPCVFWPHWKSYQSEINELIAVRKLAGIHSESAVIEEESGPNKYTATIQGHRGSVVLRLGSNRSKDVPEGYELAVEGGDRGAYTLFIKKGAQGIDEVKGGKGKVKGEKFMQDGKLFIRHGDNVYDILGNRIL